MFKRQSVFAMLLMQLYASGVLAQEDGGCADFSGYWGGIQSDIKGTFQVLENIYPTLKIIQRGCGSFDLGRNEVISEVGKYLSLSEELRKDGVTGTIRADWMDESQQVLKVTVNAHQIVESGPLKGTLDTVRTTLYSLVNGKLTMEIERSDIGDGWSSVSSARLKYSDRSEVKSKL